MNNKEIDEDKEKNLIIKELLEEIRLEKLNAEEQIQIEKEESAKRRIQLMKTRKILKSNGGNLLNEISDDSDSDEETAGLPNTKSPPELNTFLYLWNQEDDEASMDKLSDKYKLITLLLCKLNKTIDLTSKLCWNDVDELKKIRLMLREKLKMWIDMSNYRLLRNIEKNMIKEDLKNARYVKNENEMICCLWALIKLPLSINEHDKKSIELYFNELELTIKMPKDITGYCMAIRGLWLKYDFYSDQSFSFDIPKLPDLYHSDQDLLEFCENEVELKRQIREDQLEERKMRLQLKKTMIERLTNPTQSASAKPDKKSKQTKKSPAQLNKNKKNDESDPESLPYLPTPDEIILQTEEDNTKELKKLLCVRCEKTEINLRKYRILGGIYHIELIHQPPQPKQRDHIWLTTIQLPKELKFVPFSRPYKAPPPSTDTERTPEVIEAEMKALETAMEALGLITLKLPENVLWFEPPLVACWDKEKNVWSTQNIHDIKYNEEKQIITFRTGQLGTYGLAAFKFINVPYQSWELKPESGKSGGVVLSITAAIVQVEFLIKESLVCLNSLTGGSSGALQNLIGKYMKLNLLIQKMQEGGCDLFPEKDAFTYIKGLPMKHSVAERHLQICMGLLSTAFMFSWSRWNATTRPRQIIMQMRELHGGPSKKQQLMVLISPQRAAFIESSEVGSEFSDKPIDDSKFFADIYHLALDKAGIKSRLLISSIPSQLSSTITQLIRKTNILSLSS